VDTVLLDLDTSTRRVLDLTQEIRTFCRGKGDGVVSVFAPHATAGLAVMELGSGSERDLDELVERLLPRDDRYVHAHGSRGHGADHLLPVLVSPSLTIPVLDGEPALGTWQSIAFVDTNPDNPKRQVRISFLAGA
jgi:secondary thiamine-phosphate synthase enzyme